MRGPVHASFRPEFGDSACRQDEREPIPLVRNWPFSRRFSASPHEILGERLIGHFGEVIEARYGSRPEVPRNRRDLAAGKTESALTVRTGAAGKPKPVVTVRTGAAGKPKPVVTVRTGAARKPCVAAR